MRTLEEKRRIVEEVLQGGDSVAVIARRHEVNANLVFSWKRQYENGLLATNATALVPIKVRKREATTRRAPAVVDGECIEIDLGAGKCIRLRGKLAIAPSIDFSRSSVRDDRTSLRAWLTQTRASVSKKSDLAGAIHYALARWRALTRYCEDGRIEIDNNIAERSLRAIALGRKNYLFAGSDAGGERAAILYSLLGDGEAQRHRSGSLSTPRTRARCRAPDQSHR